MSGWASRAQTPLTEVALRAAAARQGLLLARVEGIEWLLYSDKELASPFTLLPSLGAVEACLRRDPLALELFTPSLHRSRGASER